MNSGEGISLIKPLTVVVIHWNRPERCAATINAFLNQGIPLKISVVDNGSSPENYNQCLKLLKGRCEVLRLEENRGFGGGLNYYLEKWLSQGEGDFIITSTHDALPEKGCLLKLLQAIMGKASIGIVSAEYGVNHLARFSALRGPYMVSVPPGGEGFEPEAFPHGTCMMIRRQCLEEIGLFDESFVVYGDEIDLALRAWSKGWEVGVVWGARVINPERSIASKAAGYYQLRNSILLVRRWRGKFWGLLRALRSLINTFLLIFWKSRRPETFSVKMRLKAIWDGLLGRSGPAAVD